jgi:hypothetical protein
MTNRPSERPGPRRPLREILDAWRSAERAVQEAAPGTPAREQAEAEVEVLRALYQREMNGEVEDADPGASA